MLQGDWGPMTVTSVGGIDVVRSCKYLGWCVGDKGPAEQYAGPMRKYELKCQQLGMLPLTLEEKAQALATWAYPVFDVVGRMVYPTDKICSRVDDVARKAMGAKSYGLTAAHLQQPTGKGGVGLILPSLYLQHLHSKRYVQWALDPDSLPQMHTKAFDSWRWPYLDNKISRESVNLATHPVQFSEGKKGEVWPSLATSAKAYG